MSDPAKRLYRSKTDRMIGGVCGGLAEYFNIDPTIVRLLWALFVLGGGSGIPVYIIAWIIIPEEPITRKRTEEQAESDSDVYDSEFNKNTGTYDAEQKIKEQLEKERRGKLAIGVGVVIVGIIFLFSQIFTWNISWRFIIGVLLILAGGAVLCKFFKEDK